MTVTGFDEEKNNKLKQERRSGLRHSAPVYYICRCECGSLLSLASQKIKNRKELGCKACKHIDFNSYIGKQTNSWLIMESVKRKNMTFFYCQCMCGKLKTVNAYNIINDQSKDCGCGRKHTLKNMNFKDVLCQKFGKLTPIKLLGTNKYRRKVYKCKCDCGNTCTVASNNLLSGHILSCGCIHSKMNSRISQFLQEENIEFIQEKFCRYNKKDYGRFDFFLSEYNLAVEYDGESHFIPVDYAGKGRYWAVENLKATQYRDSLKNKYCKENDIKLLRIPYWEKENYKTIILNYIIALND